MSSNYFGALNIIKLSRSSETSYKKSHVLLILYVLAFLFMEGKIYVLYKGNIINLHNQWVMFKVYE